jgi:hypothetical protein
MSEGNSVEFVGVVEGARRAGVSIPLIGRLIAAGKLRAYVDPLDARRKLVKVADLDRLRKPRPLRRDDR